MKLGVLTSLILLFIYGLVYSERNVSLDLYSLVTAYHTLSNETLPLKNQWNYGTEIDGHLLVAPEMSFEDNYQSDALLDLYIARKDNTNSFDISLREAFIDYLFYNTVGVKAGFIRLDFGYNNSYFHPLNVMEMFPELKSLYGKIFIGNSDQGFKGVPSAQIKLTIPEFVPDLKISYEQSMVWASPINLYDNYFLSKIGAIYGNLDTSLVMGYNGYSWSNYTNSFRPVLGGSLSYRLPFSILFYSEVLYKYETYRVIVTNDILTAKRSGNFFDVDLLLSYSGKEALFNNQLSTSLEYLFYGEGMVNEQYNSAYKMITNNPFLSYTYSMQLLQADRNFQKYLYGSLYYTIQNNFTIGYSLKDELESQFIQHTVSLAKNFNNSIITAAMVFNQTSEEKYQINYMANDMTFYLSLMLSL